jgi:uncharacterized protein
MNQSEQDGDGVRPLEPAVRTVWRIKLGLLSFLFFGGVLAYDAATFFGSNDRWLPFGAAAGLVFVLGLVLTLVQPALRYRYWRFALRAEELYLERGVLNRVRTIVPLRRIQHLDVSQDVLEREFGLGKLIVHTAGARSSEVVLPGLRYEDAQRLRDMLKDYIIEDAV